MMVSPKCCQSTLLTRLWLTVLISIIKVLLVVWPVLSREWEMRGLTDMWWKPTNSSSVWTNSSAPRLHQNPTNAKVSNEEHLVLDLRCLTWNKLYYLMVYVGLYWHISQLVLKLCVPNNWILIFGILPIQIMAQLCISRCKITCLNVHNCSAANDMYFMLSPSCSLWEDCGIVGSWQGCESVYNLW